MGHLAHFLDDARQRVHMGIYDLEGPALRPNGSLVAAIQDDPAAVMAELKPRSPSQGRLLQGSPGDLLAAYKEGGAAALSVLTDADWFDGSPGLLRLAHTTDLPVMMKDFIVDEAQLRLAAHNGASAVLLIERCLEPRRRETLVTAAHALGLEVLLEVCRKSDWDTAQSSAADLFGVNARDLDTLELDAPASLELVQTIHDAGRPVIALSGITDRASRLRANKAGAKGVLVGTHLAKSPDPGLWLKALRHPLAKVCGITRQADVDLAAAAGADLVGFVVGAESPRAIAALRAQQLSDHAHSLGLRTVLVTPHEDAWEVREWCRVVRPDFVQLTRLQPDAEWIHSIASIPTRVLHAVGPDEPTPLSGIGLVLDTPSKHGSGGSGLAHDWGASARHVSQGRFSLVAGGLAGDNAAEAIQATGAWGADASSRLESSPGCKDPEAVKAFVQVVHDA